jgi:hypothetical protein
MVSKVLRYLLRKSYADVEMASLLHTYTDDLHRLTLLREKSIDDAERERYENIVATAQKTLERLLELNDTLLEDAK